MQRTFTQKKSGFGFWALTLLCVFSLSANFSFAQGDAKVVNPTLNHVKKATLADKLAYEAQLKSVNTRTNNDAGIVSSSKLFTTSGTSNLGPEAVCATLTGALGAGDLTMSPRFFRGGAPANGNCTTPYPYPGPSGTGPYYYDLHTYTNNTGLTQCGTFTLTTTDVTNANIQFAIYNGTFNPANLATNYLADPDVSTGTPADPAGISLQLTVNAGQTLQIIVFSANVNTAASGTASNYTLTIDFPLCSSTPCSGTPAPGNTLSTSTSICSNLPYTLSLQNATPGSGVSYQWQSSSTGAPGSFTDIVGATSATYATSATATTWYQAKVTCGANTGTSNPVQVTIVPCYCTAGATSTAFEKISNVTFGTINNNSTSTAGYEDFTALSTNAFIGASMPISVSLSGGFAADQVLVWIDLNRDFDFNDPGELVYTSANGVGPHNGTIVIPAGTTPGTTRMRVRMHDTSLGANNTPCGTSTYGQVEDYTVNLVPCVPASVTTQPASQTVGCGSNATFTVALAGSATSAYWEYRTSATGTWVNVPNAAPYSGVNTTTLTITGSTASMNGYQYRAVYQGACAGVDFTNAATLTVSPLVANITKTPAGDICLGSIQRLSIANTQPATVVTFSSAANLNITIPDNGTSTGVNNSITVSGIPAGVLITDIKIKMNLTHTWAGDMIVVAKAPSNKILNLAYALNATGGAAATTGFQPTFAKTATAFTNSGTNPYSGTFAADGYNPTTGDPTVPTGPTGFLPTSTATTRNTFNDLYPPADNSSTLNGTWTLAMYDYYDDGLTTNKFNNWSIEITYTGGLATGVWTSPTPNSLYTDAAATVPYNGTSSVNTVYAKPTTAGVTNYTVVVNNGLCTSAATTVPVTANQLATSVSAVSNHTICQNGTTSFTANSVGGFGNTLQWQVSADNGASWTNITNGGVYDGATTGTLTVTGASFSMNNYRYRLVASAAPCTGTVNSTAGILTVNPLPVLTISANPYTAIQPGQTTTLAVASTTTIPANGYKWYRNGVLVPGATGNTLVVDVDALGEYTVTVSDANSCGAANTPSITISSAASDILFIYPSPNSGQFQVRYYSAPGNNPLPRYVNIYDSKGSRVYSRSYSVAAPYTRLDVDLSRFNSGIYQVELSDRNGNRIKTGRVLVQK